MRTSGASRQWFRCAREETRLGHVIAKIVANFQERCFKESSELFPISTKWEVTIETSQVWEYLGFGGVG